MRAEQVDPLISGMNGVIEKYEKDKKMEKYDLQIVIDIKWTDNASYKIYEGGDVNQTIWNLKYSGYGKAVSRLYRTPHPPLLMLPAKIEVAAARFTMKPRTISAVCYFISKSSSTTSNGVKQLVRPTESAVAGPGITTCPGEGFTLDFTLSAGVIAPTTMDVPMTMMVPFMTAIDPKKIMDTSKMTPKQLMANFPAAMEGTFKIPISTDMISFDELKTKKTVVIHVQDSKTGPGLIGMGKHVEGTQRCSYDGNIFVTIGEAGSMLKYPRMPQQSAPLPVSGGTAVNPAPTSQPAPPTPPNPPVTPLPVKDKKGQGGGFVGPAMNAESFTDIMVEYYKAGNYSGIYEAMASAEKSSMTLNEWMETCNSQKQKLGALIRYHRSALYSDSASPVAATDVEYGAQFARADGNIRISAVMESGQWRVKAFVVN